MHDHIKQIPVVYIAGPYRAATRHQVHRNVRAAEEVGHAVMALGAMPLIPHANTFHLDGAFPDARFLDGDLALLWRCDAMVACPGWHTSEGTMAEIRFSASNGIPWFDCVDEMEKLADWIANYKGKTK